MKKNKWKNFCHPTRMLRGLIILMAMIDSRGPLQGAAAGHQNLKHVPIEINLQKGEKLQSVLERLQEKTDFNIFYANAHIADVTTSITRDQLFHGDAHQLLTMILRNTDLTFKKEGNEIIITRSTSTQDREVSGKVVSAEGEPLSGVTVSSKERPSLSTSTDDRGNFRLTVRQEDTILIFKSIGYKAQNLLIGRSNVYRIVLERTTGNLEEVVVVGYGTQRKASLTGSVAQVRGDDIRRTPTATLSNTLAGRAPGIIARQNSGQPGADQATISVRGKSTFGNNNMLILVDGVVRNFDQINPAEIETVSILKDASSAAIYGARAANGVLLITTKRGLLGEPSISYNGYTGIQQPAVRAHLLDAVQYMEMFNAGLASTGQNHLYTPEDIERVRNYPEQLPGRANTDWWKETMQPWAPMSQHDLNLSGGSEKAKYFASLGYLDQGSLYRTSDFKRYNFRSNIDAKIGRNISATLDVAGRYEDRQNPSSNMDIIFGAIMAARPTDPAYFSNGLPAVSNGRSPILEATQSGTNRDNWTVFQSNASLKYDVPFLEGLSLKGVAAFDISYNTGKNFYTPYSYYSYQAERGDYEQRRIDGTINLNQRSHRQVAITTQAIANYTKKLDRHAIDATAIYETYTLNGSTFSAYREQYLSALMPQELFAGSETAMRNDGSSSVDARAGWAGRFDYGFDERYLLSTTFRYDGSMRFPKGRRWGFFPGVSAGWVLSKESFMQDAIAALDFFKFKIGYGQLGNDQVALFQFLPAYRIGSRATSSSFAYIVDGLPVVGIFPSNYPNPDITWERANAFDVGFESGWWNGKLSLEAGYFRKKTTDILLQRTAAVPGTFGELLPSENIGITQNQGIELDLGHRSTMGKVNFNARGTFTYARSKVLYMDEAANVLETIRQTGRPFDQYRGWQAIGLFQSQEEIENAPRQMFGTVSPGDIRYADINGDGVVDDKDRTVIGRSNVPELVFGLSLGASWKGFDIDMLWQGAGRFNTYLSGRFAHAFSNGANPYRYMLDYWTPENPNAAFPRPVAGGTGNNQRFSSFWLADATYLRLRSMHLGYTIPATVLAPIGVKRCRVFVGGSNLLTFSKMYGLDPEQPSESRGYYPQQRIVNLGLNVNL
ncbi:SusC/RagA family TonB-linked outer membrane protein [Sphingobacterium griseoflavum]|uniref:SusC/RagA family TonB-linked outer membrane protein n=1 Tax=Sphingobacterium griseoflavum TaxID=1474952 RepID=A0ABQ3HUL2_9SPHI|nr:SusC/RagA family TonB-linked outer membrane protein [Sphingobacterium griseoflavum]GHE28620.1 SusC/RagA family TonB-linked outer membrane protein [Sphingobacterium griseoflavum]